VAHEAESTLVALKAQAACALRGYARKAQEALEPRERYSRNKVIALVSRQVVWLTRLKAHAAAHLSCFT
jgi:predicted nucleic acid-binding Zn ribbon protein